MALNGGSRDVPFKGVVVAGEAFIVLFSSICAGAGNL